MKSSLLLAAACLTLVSFKLSAATTHYVNASGTNAVTPYTDWSTAATNIQDAVDVAAIGDTVLVSNGVYTTGGRQLSSYDVTNRVAVTNALILQSVNGPLFTFIQGYQVADSSKLTNAVRCVYLASGARLTGFTLTNGQSGTGNYIGPGGIWAAGSGTVVSNCVLTVNHGGGAGGQLY